MSEQNLSNNEFFFEILFKHLQFEHFGFLKYPTIIFLIAKIFLKLFSYLVYMFNSLVVMESCINKWF